MDPIHMNSEGWWFYDETRSVRYGPYESEQEAKIKMNEYAKSLGPSSEQRELFLLSYGLNILNEWRKSEISVLVCSYYKDSMSNKNAILLETAMQDVLQDISSIRSKGVQYVNITEDYISKQMVNFLIKMFEDSAESSQQRKNNNVTYDKSRRYEEQAADYLKIAAYIKQRMS